MKERSGEKIRLASVEELLGVPDEQGATEIELSRIQPFRNHPFYVRDDEQMDNLVESIKANGVLTPVLVRETDSGYEMVSGHRRMHASIRAGLATIPAIIKDMTDDEAIVYMVDANIQREELLPSEKAFAIKMKLEAMKRQTGRKASEKNSSGSKAGGSGKAGGSTVSGGSGKAGGSSGNGGSGGSGKNGGNSGSKTGVSGSKSSSGSGRRVLNEDVVWTGRVTASSLNVRVWAGTENPVVSFSPLKKGTKIGVCDELKDQDHEKWYYIAFKGRHGFVCGKYVERV